MPLKQAGLPPLPSADTKLVAVKLASKYLAGKTLPESAMRGLFEHRRRRRTGGLQVVAGRQWITAGGGGSRVEVEQTLHDLACELTHGATRRTEYALTQPVGPDVVLVEGRRV